MTDVEVEVITGTVEVSTVEVDTAAQAEQAGTAIVPKVDGKPVVDGSGVVTISLAEQERGHLQRCRDEDAADLARTGRGGTRERRFTSWWATLATEGRTEEIAANRTSMAKTEAELAEIPIEVDPGPPVKA